MTRVLYGLDGDERVDDELDYVIESYVDRCWPDLPTTLTVLHHAPRKVEDVLGSWWFENLLETLGEELDYEDAWQPTLKLLAARDEFEKVLKAEYHVTVCEPNGERTVVDLREWLATQGDSIRDGEPQWLSDDDAKISES